MAWDDIALVYRTGASHISTTSEHHIFTAKAVITFSNLIVVILTVLGFSIYVWKKHRIQIISDPSLYLTLPRSPNSYKEALTFLLKSCIFTIQRQLGYILYLWPYTQPDYELQDNRTLWTS